MIVLHRYPRLPSRGNVPTEGGATMRHSRFAAACLCGTSSMFAACSKPSEPIEPIEVFEPPSSIAIQKLAGDDQTDTVLATLPMPLRVQVVRSGGMPQSARVIWRPEGQLAVFTRADVTGVASFTWTLPNPSSPYRSLKVDVLGADSSVYFTVRVEGGRPVAIGKEFEGTTDAQVGLGGKRMLWKYGVFGFDAHGNDNASGALDVNWVITSGGGTIGDICGPECWCPDTPSKCVFYTSARHTLGLEEGINTVTATAPTLPAARPLTFTTVGVTALVEIRALVAQAAKNAAFVPDSVSVPAGKTVGWIWVGDYDPEHLAAMEKHDVVFEDDPSSPASATPRLHGIHTRKFTAPGRYRYRCTLHSSDFSSGEVGIVTVGTGP